MSAIPSSRINADIQSVGLPYKSALINTRLVHVGHTQSTFAGAKVQKIFDVNKF